MKIAYILHTTKMAGATISFLNMVIELKERYSITPLVVCPHEIDSEFARILNENKIEYYKTYLPGVYVNESFTIIDYTKLLYRELKCFFYLRSVIKRIKPDIIHSNTGVLYQGFFVAKSLRISHVWHLREYQDRDFNLRIFPNKSIYSKLLSMSTVITISQDILKHFMLEKSRTAYCIYNGIIKESNICYKPQKENRYLTACRVSPEKGFDEVIPVFCQFCKKYPSMKLLIYGYGEKEYIDKLKQIVVQKNCQDNIQFLGYRSVEEVTKDMQDSKALIVGSYYEGFGRMTAEANLLGCLVIGRYAGGTREILDITDGLKFNTPDELYNQLITSAEMPSDDLESIILKAQNKAKIFTVEQNAMSVFEVYKQIK